MYNKKVTGIRNCGHDHPNQKTKVIAKIIGQMAASKFQSLTPDPK